MAAAAADSGFYPGYTYNSRTYDYHRQQRDHSPMNSIPGLDNDFQEKRKQELVSERHEDMLKQQRKEEEKRKDMAMVSRGSHIQNPFLPSENSGPKDNFETHRQKLTEGYNKQYDQVLQESEQQRQKEEERRRQRAALRAQEPAPPQAINEVDYNEAREHGRLERVQDYQDHRKQREEYERQFRPRQYTPQDQVGLDVGHYEKKRKEEAPLMKKAYKEELDKQSQQQMQVKLFERTSDNSPVHVGYRETERPLVGSPRELPIDINVPKEQAKKDLIQRAQREGEIPIIDRSGRGQYLQSKPPQGPSAFRTQEKEEERIQRDREREQAANRSTGVVQRGPFYDSETLEKHKQGLKKEYVDQYRQWIDEQNRLKPMKKGWKFDEGTGVLISDDVKQAEKKMQLRSERKKDYIEYMDQKRDQHPMNRTWPEPEGRGALLVKEGEYESKRKFFDEQRRKDLRRALENKEKRAREPPRNRSEPAPAVNGSYPGFFANLGNYDRDKELKRREMQADLSEHLRQDEMKHGRPAGRPNWAAKDDMIKEPANDVLGSHGLDPRRSVPDYAPRHRDMPSNRDDYGRSRDQRETYEEILQKHRGKEAQSRRFDDPEVYAKLADRNSARDVGNVYDQSSRRDQGGYPEQSYRREPSNREASYHSQGQQPEYSSRNPGRDQGVYDQSSRRDQGGYPEPGYRDSGYHGNAAGFGNVYRGGYQDQQAYKA